MAIVKQVWNWIDDRTGFSETVGPMAKHLVPPDTGWLYVFGSATLFAFVVQVVTGIALATVYVSSSGQAYESLQFITHDALLGRVLRGMHYWGASAMILFVGVHMIRVFLMGSYKFPRESNWLTGSVLLLLTVLMGFTGQLLRWDQNAVWTTVVAAEQAGRVPFIGHLLAQFILAGNVVGGATLSRFFSYHVFFIPALIFAFVGVHLYLVLRNGISDPPKPGRIVDPKTYRAWYEDLIKRKGVPFWPDAAWRDVVFAVIMITGIVVLAVIFGPPELTKPPDPAILEAVPRPDWYLLWYFAVLALVPHRAEAYIIVGGPILFGLLLVLLPFLANRGERSPRRRPWAVAIVVVAVVMVGVLWLAGTKSPWSPDFSAKPLPQKVIGAASGPVFEGAQLFHEKGCEYCHNIEGYGGHRGPNLTKIGDRLTADQMTIRILNGGYNMPAFGHILNAQELNNLVAFLQSRKTD